MDDATIILSKSTIRSSSLSRNLNHSVARDVCVCLFTIANITVYQNNREDPTRAEKLMAKQLLIRKLTHIVDYPYVRALLFIAGKVFHVICIVLNRFSTYHFKYHNLLIKKL